MAERSLKDKREAFVLAYIGTARFNATRAAEMAGYAEPASEGYRLLRNATIRARIDKYLDAEALNAKEVLAELAEMARAPFDEFVEVIARDREGNPVKVKMDLSAKVKSLELIGKHHQLFTDKLNVTGAITFADLHALAAPGAGADDPRPGE